MAAYGTLVAWARAMGHTDAAEVLQQTLNEEKAADKKLTQLADGGINREAAAAAHPADEDAPSARRIAPASPARAQAAQKAGKARR